VAPDVPDALVGDAGRLRQALLNLVGNAIKFTECGEVVLEVEEAGRRDGAIGLHFIVRDTGGGIPADKQSFIFEPFAQAEGRLRRKIEGTGLGLAITARLAELMGGQLALSSEVGWGSTFHFTAWFGLREGPAEHPVSKEAERDRPCPEPQRPLRILLAE